MALRRAFVLCFATVGLAAASNPPPTVFDVRAFGALGTMRTNDTAAIQRAIDSTVRAGGGTVFFPAGDYLSGTLILRSRVTLYLSSGATIWGSRDMKDYNPPHLIYASNAEHLAIEGSGTINGQGDAFWEADFRPRPRPTPLIEFHDCRDVQIRDISIRNAPAWTIHPKNCDRVTIRGISIINHRLGRNTDGIDPDSSRNVLISDCYIEAGDDCIVLKTTEEAGRKTESCENVTVTNCVLVSSGSALKLGTESYADFRHCAFSNCAIRDSRTGIALLAKDGGVIEQVLFSNLTIETHPKFGKGVEWPIVIDIEKRRPNSRISRIRDVCISDIVVHTKGRIAIGGMPDSFVEGVTLRNVTMRITGPEQRAGVTKLHGGTVEPVPGAVDYGEIPAVLILTHARDIDLRDVKLTWEQALETRAIYAEKVTGLRIDAFSAPHGAILLKASDHVRITGTRVKVEHVSGDHDRLRRN